ncbi:MAG: nickel pincer cofactor biosynthesis protein LarC [Acidobacteriota bacterium]|nr:nickel pincer cofactor biosynthesis protein LarC [Blastocatellia bacterium]MDW8240384.1 nickel pincer cofactor biosynthesis protein LarC [Acidobacteriota bacterium]
MRTLYFDCFSGASGDMINGALIDLGVRLSRLQEELSKLPLSGYQVRAVETRRAGLRAIKFDVDVDQSPQPARRLSDILAAIESAPLADAVKRLSQQMFIRLGEAEAKAHGVSLEDVHFHEVGAVDAIVDIVGACIGFKELGIERFICSPINVGRGMVNCSHGQMPVPVVATAELLKGAIIYNSDIEAELVTPTGATIISTVTQTHGSLPPFKLEKVGYGAGTKQWPDRPNLLRLMLGETPGPAASVHTDKVTVIEANIDDSSPELLGYLMEQGLKAGALDVFYTPIQMKKNRPATKLTVICRDAERERMAELIFRETTTIGLRFYEAERRLLDRQWVQVATPFGLIRVKVAYLNESVVNLAPEYDDCKAAAEQHQVPLRQVIEHAIGAFNAQLQRSTHNSVT